MTNTQKTDIENVQEFLDTLQKLSSLVQDEIKDTETSKEPTVPQKAHQTNFCEFLKICSRNIDHIATNLQEDNTVAACYRLGQFKFHVEVLLKEVV